MKQSATLPHCPDIACSIAKDTIQVGRHARVLGHKPLSIPAKDHVKKKCGSTGRRLIRKQLIAHIYAKWRCGTLGMVVYGATLWTRLKGLHGG